MSSAIAEAPANLVDLSAVDTSATDGRETLSIGRVVASLQLLLAARRAARNQDFARQHDFSSEM